jgi:predicted AAA+ superfamily ATPase
MITQFEDKFEYLGNGSGLIGRDIEKKEVVYRIASGNMLLIEGARGTGKTALLKYAIDNFKGLGKVVYIDVGTFGRRLDIANLLKGRPRGMILLIDNIEYLSESNNKKIKYFYDQDYIKSVVFTTVDSKAISFTDAIRSRIGRNVLKLGLLSQSDILKVAEDRLDEEFVVSDEVLGELYRRSEGLKDFLVNCDSLCDYLHNMDKVEAEISDVDEIVFKDDVEFDVETCLECNGKLVEIHGHWRCKNCDEYCDVCGVLSDESECPACGAEIFVEGKDE